MTPVSHFTLHPAPRTPSIIHPPLHIRHPLPLHLIPLLMPPESKPNRPRLIRHLLLLLLPRGRIPHPLIRLGLARRLLVIVAIRLGVVVGIRLGMEPRRAASKTRAANEVVGLGVVRGNVGAAQCALAVAVEDEGGVDEEAEEGEAVGG